MKMIYINYLNGLALLIVAVLLLAICSPFFVVYAIIRMAIGIKILGLFRLVNKWLFKIAVSLDQLGNVLSEKLFNDILIKKSSQDKFGNEDETISSVIGKNHLANQLTLVGKLLNAILHIFDKNHSVEAIEKE